MVATARRARRARLPGRGCWGWRWWPAGAPGPTAGWTACRRVGVPWRPAFPLKDEPPRPPPLAHDQQSTASRRPVFPQRDGAGLGAGRESEPGQPLWASTMKRARRAPPGRANGANGTNGTNPLVPGPRRAAFASALISSPLNPVTPLVAGPLFPPRRTTTAAVSPPQRLWRRGRSWAGEMRLSGRAGWSWSRTPNGRAAPLHHCRPAPPHPGGRALSRQDLSEPREAVDAGGRETSIPPGGPKVGLDCLPAPETDGWPQPGYSRSARAGLVV